MKSSSLLSRSLLAGLLFFVLIGFARRAAADLYVSDYGANQIYRYTPDGVQHAFASLTQPWGLAFDADNNLYVAAVTKSRIYKIDPNGQYSIFAGDRTIQRPRAIAFDSTGNLFVAHGYLEAVGISKIAPNGTISPFLEGVDSSGIAFDSAGYLFAGENRKGDVIKIAPDGTFTSFAHPFRSPWDLAFDADGNLFVADYVAGIFKVTPDGTKTKFATASRPIGLIFDHSGYLFVSALDQNGVGIILQFAPDGTKSTFATGLITPSYFAIPNSQ